MANCEINKFSLENTHLVVSKFKVLSHSQSVIASTHRDAKT